MCNAYLFIPILADCNGWTPASQWNPCYTFYPPIYICSKWWWETWIWIWIREHKYFGKTAFYKNSFSQSVKNELILNSTLLLQISMRMEQQPHLWLDLYCCIWVSNITNERTEFTNCVIFIEQANDYTSHPEISHQVWIMMFFYNS